MDAMRAFWDGGRATTSVLPYVALSNARHRVWLQRGTTLGLVAAFLLLSRAFVPDPFERIEFQYLTVLPLGYGHLGACSSGI